MTDHALCCDCSCCLNRGGGQRVSPEAAKTTPDEPPWDPRDRDRTARNRNERKVIVFTDGHRLEFK